MSMTKCASCEEPVSAIARICPHCGQAAPVAVAPAIINAPCSQCGNIEVSPQDEFACRGCGCPMLRLDGVYSDRGWHFRFYNRGPVVVYMVSTSDAQPGSKEWISKIIKRLHSDGHDIESRRFQFGRYTLTADGSLTADLSGPDDGGRIEIDFSGRLLGHEIQCNMTRNAILEHPNGREESAVGTVPLQLRFYPIPFDDLERVA